MKKMRVPVVKDSVINITTGGGGGWGNAYKREVESVLNDVVNGYISISSAKKDYGVIINPGSLKLNKTETQKLRNKKIIP